MDGGCESGASESVEQEEQPDGDVHDDSVEFAPHRMDNHYSLLMDTVGASALGHAVDVASDAEYAVAPEMSIQAMLQAMAVSDAEHAIAPELSIQAMLQAMAVPEPSESEKTAASRGKGRG